MIGNGLLLAALIAHAPTTPPAAAPTGLAAPASDLANAAGAAIKDGAPAQAANPADSTIQGDGDAEGRMTVDVRIGGRGPYRFLVDTGAQNTIVSTKLAGDLGLTAGPPVRVVSMGAADRVETGRVDSLEIGNHRFRNLLVPLLDAEHIGADGIIGMDSLQGRRIVLDFVRNRMTIGEERADHAGLRRYDITVPAKRRSGRLVMADAVIDGIRTAVILDTGSSTTIGNLALQRAIQNRLWGSVTLNTATGAAVPAKVGLVDNLRMGGLTITNLLVAFTGASVFTELALDERPAIFLGMREIRGFKRIAIDFAKQKVQFTTREARRDIALRE